MNMEYFRCCAAISLNNTAITLMERQQHYLAYETLRDGLSLFAEVGDEVEHGDRGEVHSQEERVALDRASQRLSRSTCPMSRIESRSDVPLIVVVPTTDSTTLGLQAETFRRSDSLLHVTPIRIEPTDAESIHEPADQQLIKAIMLYNYGVSLQCAWRSMLGYRNGNCADPRWTSRNKVRLHVLREATEITSKLCLEAFSSGSGGGGGDRKSAVDPGKTLSVAIVVHSSYLEALEEAEVVTEAVDCSVKLFLLNSALASVLDDRIVRPNFSTASAA